MKNLFRFFLVMALLLLASCASLNEQRVKLMMKAGFKIVPVTTESEQKQFEKLPPGEISNVMCNGKVAYLYPDPTNNQILIGTPQQLKRYNKYLSRKEINTLKMSNRIEEIKKEQEIWGKWKGWDTIGWDDPSLMSY